MDQKNCGYKDVSSSVKYEDDYEWVPREAYDMEFHILKLPILAYHWEVFACLKG